MTPARSSYTSTSTRQPPAAAGTGDVRPKRRLLSAAEQSKIDEQSFLPLVNIIGVLFGMIFAFGTVPWNPTHEGALFTPALGLTLGMSIGPILVALANPKNLLRTENVIGFMPFYWLLLDLVTGAAPLEGLNPESIRKTFLVVGFYLIFYWVGTMNVPWRLPEGFLRSCSLKPEVSVLMPIVLVCFGIAMLKFLIPCKFDLVLMFKSVSGARWSAPWGRGEFGGWDAFADHLSYFGYLLPTFTVMIALKKSWLNPSTLVAVLCSIIFLLFLSQSGARRIVGVCLAAAMFTWILNQKNFRAWHLLVLVGSTALILWIMQMMIISRGFGNAALEIGTVGSAAVDTMKGHEIASGAPKAISVDDNFYRLAQTIALVPEKYPYAYYKPLYFLLARPIPRILWPGKPTNAGFELYKLLASGASLSTSMLGELWISIGFPSVMLGGWFFGRLARMSSPLFHTANGTIGPMFYGYITMTLFVGFRSLVEVILFSYALLAWMAAIWIIKKWR